MPRLSAATMTSCTRWPASAQAQLVRLELAGFGLVGLEARAGVEVVRQLARKRQVGAPDRLDLVDAAVVVRDRRLETDLELLERPFDQCEMEVALVLEVDVDQRAAQACTPRHLVHGDRVPAEFRVERLRGIDDLSAAAVPLFLAAFRDVRHAPMLSAV